MQLIVSCSIWWHGKRVEAGETITVESPADDAMLAYYNKFGAFQPVAAGASQAPPPPGQEAAGEAREETESHATPPISTTMPGVVGRRQRRVKS